MRNAFHNRGRMTICHIQAEEDILTAAATAAAAAVNLRCAMGTDITAEPTGLFTTSTVLPDIISARNPILLQLQKRGKSERSSRISL